MQVWTFLQLLHNLIKEAAMRGIGCMCLILAMIACSSEKPAQVDILTEDGVLLVLNHLESYRIKDVPARLTID
jgi:hypothetical protein